MKSMAKIFWLLLSIFTLSSVIQSHDPLAAQIMVEKYILDHSFWKDLNPNEVVGSLILDTSVIGTDFNEYNTDQELVDRAKSLALLCISRLQQNYLTLIDTDIVSQIQQVSHDICGVSKELPLRIEVCDFLLLRYFQTNDIEELALLDLIKIQDHLSNIRPPKVTDITTLKEHLNLYIVISTFHNFMVTDQYIIDHSFLGDINPRELVDSYNFNTSTIDFKFNDHMFVAITKRRALMYLGILQQNYLTLINADSLLSMFDQISIGDSCNVSQQLPLSIHDCRLSLQRNDIKLSSRDCFSINHYLDNISPPQSPEHDLIISHGYSSKYIDFDYRKSDKKRQKRFTCLESLQ